MRESVKKQMVTVFLKKQWRSGMRWVVYKNVRSINAEDSFCSKNYNQAVSYCKENNLSSGMSYMISAMSDLLNKMTNAKKLPRAKIISKKELCRKYPELSFSCDTANTHTVPMDTYFPVIWNRVINNLTDIKEWQVMSDNGSRKILFRSANYADALGQFMCRCNETADKGLKEAMQAKLIGLTGSIVAVYQFYYNPRRACYMLDKKTDTSKPFLYPINYFAKYNSRLKRLEFFDGELKRIQAGMAIGVSDIQYDYIEFSNEENVENKR